MGWNKDGSTIRANYLDKYDVTGVVTNSRVKYGGTVQYTVLLDEPIFVSGDQRDVLLIDEDEVTADFGVIAGAPANWMEI